MNFACFVDWCYVWVKEQAEYFHINQQFFYREMTDTTIKNSVQVLRTFIALCFYEACLLKIFVSKGVSLMLPHPT